MPKVELTEESLKAHVRDLGVKDLAPFQVKDAVSKLAKGEMVTFGTGSKNLGRCYNGYSGVALNVTDESKLPRGNGGSSVTGRGEHPVLGAWVKYYYEVDSSD